MWLAISKSSVWKTEQTYTQMYIHTLTSYPNTKTRHGYAQLSHPTQLTNIYTHTCLHSDGEKEITQKETRFMIGFQSSWFKADGFFSVQKKKFSLFSQGRKEYFQKHDVGFESLRKIVRYVKIRHACSTVAQLKMCRKMSARLEVNPQRQRRFFLLNCLEARLL